MWRRKGAAGNLTVHQDGGAEDVLEPVNIMGVRLSFWVGDFFVDWNVAYLIKCQISGSVVEGQKSLRLVSSVFSASYWVAG